MSPMPGCVSEPLGCGLIETPGNANVHGLPSLPCDRGRIVAAAGRLEEAATGFEHDRRRGPAERRELRRDDTAIRRSGPGGTASSSCRSSRAGRPTGSRAMPSARRVCSTSRPMQSRRSRRGADRAHRGGRVKAVVVVARIDRFGDLASRLPRRSDTRHEHVEPGRLSRSPSASAAGSDRRGRMREQSVDAILGDRELRVVVVVGVDRDPFANAAKRAGSLRFVPITVQPRLVAQPSVFRYVAYEPAGFGGVAGEREARGRRGSSACRGA